jgi:hypothetical protein
MDVFLDEMNTIYKYKLKEKQRKVKSVNVIVECVVILPVYVFPLLKCFELKILTFIHTHQGHC